MRAALDVRLAETFGFREKAERKAALGNKRLAWLPFGWPQALAVFFGYPVINTMIDTVYKPRSMADLLSRGGASATAHSFARGDEPADSGLHSQ